MSNSCNLEVKMLKGQKVILEDISLNETVAELYDRVAEFENTPDGKWKMMLITKSVRTLRKSDSEKKLSDYGAEAGQQYRVEVILDMGACHTTCKR
jgi:hypothetical protein